MNKKFKLLLNSLKEVLFVYQPASIHVKKAILKDLSGANLDLKHVLDYHECLLFISAYPDQPEILNLSKQELNRIAAFIKQLSKHKQLVLNDTGLPYTTMITRFSCDILNEMIKQYHCKIEIDSFEETGTELNTLLNITLPSVLKQETTAGLDNISLMNVLGVKPNDRMTFLLNEFSKLDNQPLSKDYLWESLKIFLKIYSKDKLYSRSFNGIKVTEVFYHGELLKKFDALALIQRKLPLAEKLTIKDKESLIGTIRKSLLLTMRETDTSTYIDPSSLLLFHLERGVSIALYGLQPERQMAFQSYIGFTAFKNGYPVAYGGSWVFGHGAMFGLNILESFRGGESGYLMCQLLRSYVQHFKLTYIEVENYQFGKDNPDGIKSGAFWFYYRFGFRPVDKKLRALAEKEYNKIANDKSYRSSEKVLIALSESNIALKLTDETPVKKEEIFNKVIKMIAKTYQGDNIMATRIAVLELRKKTNFKKALNEKESQIFEEVALWAKAYHISDPEKLKLLMKMTRKKTENAFEYNELVKKLLAKP